MPVNVSRTKSELFRGCFHSECGHTHSVVLSVETPSCCVRTQHDAGQPGHELVDREARRLHQVSVELLRRVLTEQRDRPLGVF